MNTHVVTRPFSGPEGRQFHTGEQVDATDWRHAQRLVEQRRLRPISPRDLTSEVKEAASGRKPNNQR